MMGLLCPMAAILTGGLSSLPIVTLTSAAPGGGLYGYVRAGSATSASIGGLSFGALSATLYPGLTTDAVADFNSGTGVGVAFAGDVVASVSGVTAIKLNGVTYSIAPEGWQFTGSFTTADFSGPAISSGTYTVQLVGA